MGLHTFSDTTNIVETSTYSGNVERVGAQVAERHSGGSGQSCTKEAERDRRETCWRRWRTATPIKGNENGAQRAPHFLLVVF